MVDSAAAEESSVLFLPLVLWQSSSGLEILPLNPWSLGGSFMVQKMAIASPVPVF